MFGDTVLRLKIFGLNEVLNRTYKKLSQLEVCYVHVRSHKKNLCSVSIQLFEVCKIEMELIENTFLPPKGNALLCWFCALLLANGRANK